MHKALLSTLGSGLLLAAVQASAVTLTFEDLAAGTILSNQYAASGAVFSANVFTGSGTSTSGKPWATNTDMTIVSSAGTDIGALGVPPLVSGNVLRSFNGWLAEDGDPSFSISFTTPVTSFSAAFAGVATGADVTLFVYNGSSLLGTVSGTGSGGPAQFTLSFASASITSVSVRPGTFNDWVGVDNITFAPVPEPGTYALMAMGVGLLAFRLRSRA